MLDSLVRVSRRVGGAADLLATELRATAGRGKRPGAQAGARTSPWKSSDRQRDVAWRAGEMQPAEARTRAERPCGSLQPTPNQRQPEPPAPTSRTPPFTTTQFHVLFNSLFKVLFNFPSRYLFAIGLGVVFSLAWSLPGTLSCTPKQLDSREKPASKDSRRTGLSPSLGRGPCQDGLGQAVKTRGGSPEHHMSRERGPGIRCWTVPVSFAITRGITVVFFSSAY